MKKRPYVHNPGPDAYSISRALQALREKDETTVRTPEERARMAKFGATLVGVRSQAFDEAADRRRAMEEEALRQASMSEEAMLEDVVPSEAMLPELARPAPPEVAPDQNK